jgi:hypothetical protein
LKDIIKKTTRIIDEILIYFIHNGIKDVDIKIRSDLKQIKIIFEISDVKIFRDDLEEIERYLSLPYQCDIDEYFWQLNGIQEQDFNLEIVGMMINSYIISKNNNKLILELIKNID